MEKKNIIIIIGLILLILIGAIIILHQSDFTQNKTENFKFPKDFKSKIINESENDNDSYIIARNTKNNMMIYIYKLNMSKFNNESKSIYNNSNNLYYYTAGEYNGFIEVVALNNHQYEIKTKMNGTGIPSNESLNTLKEFNTLNNLSATTV